MTVEIAFLLIKQQSEAFFYILIVDKFHFRKWFIVEQVKLKLFSFLI